MIKLENIDVTFTQGKKVVKAVRNVSVNVEDGDIYGIIGYSGAGKSTLVRTINLLQRPTSGNVEVNGVDLLKLKPNELRDARKKIGMIFQHFNLMNTLSVFDNVAFPLKKAKKPLVEEGETAVDPTAEPKLVKLTKQEIKEKVDSLLQLVGLEDKANSYPSQLSGGQKQRVAIARALANDPDVLLCDEATSALDPKTTYSILELLKKVNEQLGITIVIITHINQGIETVLSHEQLLNLKDGDYLVKISFVGASTGEPLITKLSTQFQVAANILFANVEIIQETPVGTLLVGLSGEQASIESALSYIKGQGVSVEVLEEKGGA